MAVPLKLERSGEIAELVIDRPDKRNAMSFEMWAALPGIAAEVDADESVKVLVVRGSGSNFCAGADISEFATRRGTADAARAYGEQVEGAAHALSNMRKPSVAMIHGYCIGGGCELALACDLRFADTSARFAITPAKLGIVYGFDSTRRLITTTSPSFAKLLLFSANQVDAEHAHRVGLIDQLVAPEELEKVTREFAETVAGRSQVSVRGAKRLIEKAMAGLDSTDAEAAALPLDAVSSADYAEGVSAFLAKRSPRFEVR
ncbi:enoyl-CoA hydratase/isomerase family protein [Pseudonocardia spinosispora]|uniref:enoyl-CoA hydratase/isomerase family protein n=1 Tax=Pseudonocardia spinosispora TaxID=103441 RepID=UPI000424830A|nr:enoyl-CoA hydratase-related protein [Pseudonocardia spinosispora]